MAQRPRLYDKVTSNSEWARKTMALMDKEEQTKKKRKKNNNSSRVPKSEAGNG